MSGCRGCGSSSSPMGTILLASVEVDILAGASFSFDSWDWATMVKTAGTTPTAITNLGGCPLCSGPNGMAILATTTAGEGCAIVEVYDHFDAAGAITMAVETSYIDSTWGLALFHVPHGRGTQVVLRNPFAVTTVRVRCIVLLTSPVTNLSSLGRFAPKCAHYNSGNIQPNAGVLSKSRIFHTRGHKCNGATGVAAGADIVTIDEPMFDWTLSMATASAAGTVTIIGDHIPTMAAAVTWYSRPAATVGVHGSQAAVALTVPGAAAPMSSPIRSAFPYNQVVWTNGGTNQAAACRLVVIGGHQ